MCSAEHPILVPKC